MCVSDRSFLGRKHAILAPVLYIVWLLHRFVQQLIMIHLQPITPTTLYIDLHKLVTLCTFKNSQIRILIATVQMPIPVHRHILDFIIQHRHSLHLKVDTLRVMIHIINHALYDVIFVANWAILRVIVDLQKTIKGVK